MIMHGGSRHLVRAERRVLRGSRAPRRRRGAIAPAALVLLLVVSLVTGVLVRRTLAQYRQLRDDERRLQATYLAESGAELAVRRAADASYVGETWQAKTSGGAGSGTVVIRVESDPDQPGRRRIQVVASFPDDAPRPMFARLERSVPTAEPTPTATPTNESPTDPNKP